MRQFFYSLLLLLTSALPALAQSGLDATFGSGGVATTNFGFGATSDIPGAMVIQSDGKILVAGSSATNIAVARYNSNGTLDNTFGSSGKVTFMLNPSSTSEQATDMILRPDGKIVLATYAYASAIYTATAVQLLSDGTMDPAFAHYHVTSLSLFNPQLGLQSDGKVIFTVNLAAGTSITRLLTDGTVDPAFPSVTDLQLSTSDLAVLPNNDFVLGGTMSNKFALAKYTNNGTKLGITTTISFDGSTGNATALALQPDGKILLTGSTSVAVGTDFGVARFNSDGSLDDSFSGDGKTTFNFAGLDEPEAVNVQTDGKIVVSGWRQAFPGDTVFASVRYLPDGQLDPCYGQGGSLIIDLPAALGRAAAIQSDGKLLFAGVSGLPDADFAVVRYIANATPTTWYRDFDGDGYGDDATAIQSCPRPAAQIVKLDANCVDIPPFFFCPTKVVFWVSQGGDCNDNNFYTHPGAAEICDGQDNDCDGQIDEGLPTTTYYRDADGDGYGQSTGELFCSNPGAGYVTVTGDCNDNNPAIHPGLSSALEICDGIDNNCNGVIDEGCSGKPTINISNVTVYESEGMALLKVNLSFITTLQVKISYATLDGTAVSTKKEKDYKMLGTTVLTIPPGTLSTTIAVPVYTDDKVENSEYFYTILSKPTNCILGNVTGVVTILDGAAPTSGGRNTNPATSAVDARAGEPEFNAMVYPNPSSSEFTIDISGKEHAQVTVYVRNALGQEIQKFKTFSNQLRFGQTLKAGLYFVQVQQGTESRIFKLVKN